MSEGRYRALLCLTQVAVGDPSEPTGIRTILIDGLDQSVDVRRWRSCSPIPRSRSSCMRAARTSRSCVAPGPRSLTNIFDTQIAAGFVGESAQSGYGNLISSVLGLRVGKTASYTRWDARPLTAEQLSYAAEDVAHLLQLADELQRRLDETGRFEWAMEECRRLEAATDERDAETAWERLPRVGPARPPGAGGCQTARRLARAHRLGARTVPWDRYCRIPPLLELAKRHPRQADALEPDPRDPPLVHQAPRAASCSRRSPPAWRTRRFRARPGADTRTRATHR